jgi:hypothetical protein
MQAHIAVNNICLNMRDFFLCAESKEEIDAAAQQIANYMKALANLKPNPVDQRLYTEAIKAFGRDIPLK